MNSKRIKLFLVDDDTVYLRLLEIEFHAHHDFDVEVFETGEQCLQRMIEKPDVIILGYHENTIETLDLLKFHYPLVPVIMMFSKDQDEVKVAAECMSHNAFDYVVKSETAFFRLQKITNVISELNHLEKELTWYMKRM